MDRSYKYLNIILCLFIQFSANTITAKSCSKVSDCSCKTDGGSVIDLSSIAKNDGTPKFADIEDSLSPSDFYSYNPCNKFTEGSCVDVAACLVVSAGPISQYIGIGTQDSSTFEYNEEGELTVQYTGDNNAITTIELLCQEGAENFIPQKMENGSYNFQLQSEAICINERISIGTILCISLLCVIVVYFGLGVVIQIFVRKQSGIKVIPNSTFWTAIPILIKDGVVFTVKRGKVSSYQKI